ncbi:class I SAM-dependent methyltransferase [Metabacillus mangrovi]|uniref:class I SAM-dependent methyltransferase n=1 Tax=Metabacillus mangrovi TaxID=1491830 RepID=UPI001F4F3446|nr:class I SAM-dependent methyltransferase [Metabacillus mangrovi]
METEKVKWTKDAEQLWNENSAGWHARSKNMWESGSRKAVIPFFTKHAEAGKTVLDIGCGDGYGSRKLAELGFSVTGIDFSRDMLSIASKENAHPNAVYQYGNAADLPFPDNAADAVLSINCLEWVSSPRLAVLEIRRIVKAGGLVCIAILGPAAGPRINSYPRLYDKPAACNTMMPWEFTKLAGEAELKLLDQLPVYKEGVDGHVANELSAELKQALSFLTLFMFKNEKEMEK